MLNPRLKKNRSGRYEIRYSEQQSDGTYRTRTQTTWTASLNEAQIVLAEFILQEKEATALVSKPTIAMVGEQYKATALARGVTDSQIHDAELVIKFFGKLLPENVTPAIFLKFRLFRNVKDGTLRRNLSVLNTIFKFGVNHKIWKIHDIPYMEMPPAGAPRDTWMDEDQEADFLALAIKDSEGEPRVTRLTRFIAVGVDTAARKSAICGLTWDRIHLKSGQIDFRDVNLKLSKKRRVPVPISDRLMPIMERAYKERLHPERKDELNFFLDHNGSARSVYDGFTGKTQYKWVTPHVMRHTSATLMLRAGIPIWEVAGVLGDTVQTVQKVYGHHCPDHLVNAVNRRM